MTWRVRFRFSRVVVHLARLPRGTAAAKERFSSRLPQVVSVTCIPGGLFGPLLETFVLGEIMKLASWFSEPLDFLHFRDKEKNEVDIVIEDADRRVVGIEVKAAATATARDFKGLAKLQQACGKRFAIGLVLYDHDQMVPFSQKLFAAPIATLWG
jgi:predicted AAA+ superfamily ATPase